MNLNKQIAIFNCAKLRKCINMQPCLNDKHRLQMKTTNKTDWHQAIIVARLRMSGTSLRQLAKDHQLYPTALSVALQRPWLKAEGIIATAIGVTPATIWPTRYEKRATKLATRKNSNPNAKISQLPGKNSRLDVDSIKQCSHDCNVNTVRED